MYAKAAKPLNRFGWWVNGAPSQIIQSSTNHLWPHNNSRIKLSINSVSFSDCYNFDQKLIQSLYFLILFNFIYKFKIKIIFF